jgi:hypothetical protein
MDDGEDADITVINPPWLSEKQWVTELGALNSKETTETRRTKSAEYYDELALSVDRVGNRA